MLAQSKRLVAPSLRSTNGSPNLNLRLLAIDTDSPNCIYYTSELETLPHTFIDSPKTNYLVSLLESCIKTRNEPLFVLLFLPWVCSGSAFFLCIFVVVSISPSIISFSIYTLIFLTRSQFKYFLIFSLVLILILFASLVIYFNIYNISIYIVYFLHYIVIYTYYYYICPLKNPLAEGNWLQ